MSTANKSTINVQGTTIAILSQREDDFISLTDIARHRDIERTDYIIQNWLRNRATVEYLGLWEQLNNPGFNSIEFDGFRFQAGLNSFALTPKRWIEATQATGLISKAGRYGGTFAHKDIAFEFATWVSVEFKLYLIKEFQRLKDDESRRLSLDWNLSRSLSKLNYRIHTDAIRAHLIPAAITPEQARFTYASEADVLNVALFWPDRKTVARCPSRTKREYARRSGCNPTAGAGQPGKPERRVHPHGTGASRAPAKTQPERHPPAEKPHGPSCNAPAGSRAGQRGIG